MYNNDSLLIYQEALPLPVFIGVADHIGQFLLLYIDHNAGRMTPYDIDTSDNRNIRNSRLFLHGVRTRKIIGIIYPIPEKFPRIIQGIQIHFTRVEILLPVCGR